MAGIREYFDKAFSYVPTIARTVILKSPLGDEVEVIVQVHLDFDAPARYLSVFVPKHEKSMEICQHLVSQPYLLLTATGTSKVRLPPAPYIYGGFHVFNGERVEIKALPLCEPEIRDESLPFTRTMFIYSENEPTQAEIEILRESARLQSIRLRLRTADFARERSRYERPVAFISHDSRDKEGIARPLAIRLQQMLCPVWFDEFSLRVGDSLREKIEQGLKECPRCIFILSPSFLSNPGWTKVEFDSIFMREILEKKHLMLPIWCGVTKNEVYEYSPSLVDRDALDWSMGLEEVSRRLYNKISTDMILPTPEKWKIK